MARSGRNGGTLAGIVGLPPADPRKIKRARTLALLLFTVVSSVLGVVWIQQRAQWTATTNAQVQTSHDGVNWVAAVSATQLAANGAVHEFKDIAALGPYVRAVSTLAGGTLPNHTIVVKLASNGPFRLVVAG